MIWTLLITALVAIAAFDLFGLRTKVLGAAREAFGALAVKVLGLAFFLVLAGMLVLAIPQLR